MNNRLETAVDRLNAGAGAGAGVNQVDRDCDNALCDASQEGHLEIVKLRLARGANGITRDHAVGTRKGYSAIVDFLTSLL